MPLAESERSVAMVAQHLGHRRGGGCDHAPAVRVAAIDVRDKSHANRVMIASGEQAGPGR